MIPHTANAGHGKGRPGEAPLDIVFSVPVPK